MSSLLDDEVTTSSSVQSVDRAASILQFLAADGELGITEIAKLLGVHKSTAFRLVATLEGHGLVEKVAGGSRYRLGVGILRLASAVRGQLDIVREARPYLQRLADELGETANLVILMGSETLYLDQAVGSSSLQMYNWIGRRNPAVSSANGRVLLNALPEADRRALIAALLGPDGLLPALTVKTIADPVELETRLAADRAQGYSVVIDEMEEGLTAVAAPIRGGGGVIEASLSLSGPSFRISADDCEHIAARVVEVAAQISARMGYLPPTRR